jgi:hypothetical protein
MRPDAASSRAGALWQALGTAYEEIARRLESGEWSGIEALGRRIGEIQTELEALLAAGATISAGGPELLHALATRRAEIERLATQARAATAAELARVTHTRAQARRYRAPTSPAPRFASARV